MDCKEYEKIIMMLQETLQILENSEVIYSEWKSDIIMLLTEIRRKLDEFV